MRFFNTIQKNMSFPDVLASIRYFIMINPDCSFKLAVGTDSQTKGRQTCFATGIHIHRIGQGAWCCISKRLETKGHMSLEEKISRETGLTYEMVNMLNEQLADIFCGFADKYKNFDCRLEAHIDIGTKGESRKLVREMTGYFEGSGINAKIKPEAYVASSYASRYSINAG